MEASECPNRSRAVNAAEALDRQRTRHRRLQAELARLDPREEQELAEERMAADLEWPVFLA